MTDLWLIAVVAFLISLVAFVVALRASREVTELRLGIVQLELERVLKAVLDDVEQDK